MHRVRQFAAHLTAQVSFDEQQLAGSWLPAEARPLFDRMPVADRRHALDVVARLRAVGVDDPDVIAAALLHDAAKADGMRLWHRVGGVLLAAFAPDLLRRLALADRRSWRHGFHLYLHHGAMSADLAADAGCNERTVAFIRGDVPGVDAHLLRALTEADDAS